ncbi:unnamed protein product [Menidia menidia]|uniref:(Atlantic silverside) hypothetical protein n=1 Tax=Menidia menidia TaxID=238744 RepID=A0A8S4BQR0_9TELE|nr:unnamed protein product [Menidia menidia]
MDGFRAIFRTTLVFVAVELCLVCCDITDGNAEHLKREHSLIKPYQGVGNSPSSQWDFWGSTLVTSSYVRLTPDERSKQGSIWNTVPCYLKDWEMHVQFKIQGSGKKNLHGDGIAIWYTKDRLHPGFPSPSPEVRMPAYPRAPAGPRRRLGPAAHARPLPLCLHPGTVFGSQDQFLGLAIFLDTFRNDLHGMDVRPVFSNNAHFHGLAVFIDTYSNDEAVDRSFPYISAMVNNGTVSYDHGKDGRSSELGGCSAEIRNRDHDTYLAIRYSKGRLTVMVDVEDKNEWKECIDIGGVRLPTGYFFGASAATGDLSGFELDVRRLVPDNHDIISMKLYQLMEVYSGLVYSNGSLLA